MNRWNHRKLNEYLDQKLREDIYHERLCKNFDY